MGTIYQRKLSSTVCMVLKGAGDWESCVTIDPTMFYPVAPRVVITMI